MPSTGEGKKAFWGLGLKLLPHVSAIISLAGLRLIPSLSEECLEPTSAFLV